MQKIPIKMSIINFHLNFQKYTLYMHLYKCNFNVHKKCEFYYALYLDIIRLGFYIFMWLFYAYIYIFLKKICIFPVHIFLVVKRKRRSCGRYDSGPLSEWSKIDSGPLLKDTLSISMMIGAQIKSAVIIV